ncbi:MULTISPECIES: hypothetical protein [unclassified Pseudoalteromonas]|uniref:hypothetical protein n=1 Tax=unclassified Pseudoalteromonas TaxID=194690 RepID=UPI0005A82521|nr:MULTISPECIES: hypothetical protein [unclassified Pseudoalteromonas]
MINNLVTFTLVLVSLCVLSACSFNTSKGVSEYKLESKRCGQKYYQCNIVCKGKHTEQNVGFEVCNAKCIDKQNQCLEFAERLKVAVEKD